MELTEHYTLENYRTGEIELKNLPSDIWEIKYGDAFERLAAHSWGLDVNPVELLFCLLFDEEGWDVIRTPLNPNRPVMRHVIGAIQRSFDIETEAFRRGGVPDIFLWDSGEEKYRFVEVKASESELNENQLEWVERWDYEFYIAQLARASENIDKERILRENRLRSD